ncbi:hypothetical protein DKX38_027145 [Salix brachista]|uniref:Uncharacterized protein n=1 Tax=Salix brachista TaxID=2182728 RepID=A0A5N5JN62_9ROSI|nr:hypothetical protein DKX38_027145 [Salix brachista]
MAKPETSLNFTVKFSVLMFRPRLQGNLTMLRRKACYGFNQTLDKDRALSISIGITKLTRSASCLLFLGSVNHRSSSFRIGQRRAELEGISIDAPQELEFDLRSGKYGTRSHGLWYTPLHDIRLIDYTACLMEYQLKLMCSRLA